MTFSLKAGEQGSALVSALWLSLILALLSIAMITVSKDRLLETKVNANVEAAWRLAESGIAVGAYNLSKPQGAWVPRDAPYELELQGETVSVYIASPRGKIDINRSSPALMAQLFAGLGYEPDIAGQMADRIADYRDEDDLLRLSGAERRDYQAGGLDGPANTPFEDIANLQHVIGLAGDDVKCLSPFLTLYNQAGALDPNLASGALREALGLADPVPAPQSRRSSLVGQVYAVTAEAPYSDKAKARVTHIIRFTAISSDPVWVHSIKQTMTAKTDIHGQSIPKRCASAKDKN